MKQFRIRRYLEVSPAFVALLCAYFYFDPAQTFLPFLFAMTLHEAGHLLALRCMRAQVHKSVFTSPAQSFIHKRSAIKKSSSLRQPGLPSTRCAPPCFSTGIRALRWSTCCFWATICFPSTPWTAGGCCGHCFICCCRMQQPRSSSE